ncbi:MAG: lipopolysaccharide heptosyltransferase family protein [Chitinophagia bacterium]|nr:lipopolysaccharide heptosyltransferase family protein [Chitinophagia bacterium]
MKLLVIRLSSIGDIVLTSPVLRCIKQQKPDYRVHYLIKPAFSALLEHCPHIDRVHLYNDKDSGFIEALAAQKFDYIIDLHHNLRTQRLKWRLKAPSTSFKKLNMEKWLYVQLKKPELMPNTSIVNRYIDTLAPLGITDDGDGLEYYLPANMQPPPLPGSGLGNNYLVASIGGSLATKQLPADQWKLFLSQFPYPTVLIGGKEDFEMGEEIKGAGNGNIWNACGKLSLHESAYMLKNARLVISNDTGMMHIAAAFNKPIISLWGNTTPQMGMYPYYDKNKPAYTQPNHSFYMENVGLSCRPCSKIGFKECPKGHFACMKGLDMQQLLQKALMMWDCV